MRFRQWVAQVCFGVFVFLSTSQVRGHQDTTEFEVIDTYELLEARLDELDLKPNDIVIFDVDFVLTMPRDPVLHVSSLRAYKRDYRALTKKIPKTYIDIAKMYYILQSPQDITDHRMPVLVKKIKGKAHQIYLTALLTGSFPQVYNAAEWRAFSLASAGYEIYNREKDVAIYEQFPKHHGAYPKRLGNLVMTNGEDAGVGKGHLMIAYIREKGLKPSRVIMVDDHAHHLADVRNKLETFYPGVEFIGYDYKAAYKVQPIPHEQKKPSRKAFRKALNNVYKLTTAAIDSLRSMSGAR